MIILKEYKNPIFRRTHLATVEVVKHTLIKTAGDRRDTMVYDGYPYDPCMVYMPTLGVY
jgi:hypothetical protein